MAQEFVIKKVSEQEPRAWQGPNGTINYYKVMVDGHDKPIEIGKKEGNTPAVGDVLFGDIEATTYPSDKFKRVSKPYGGSQTGSKPAGGVPRDDSHIKAQWALGQAIRLLNEPGKDLAEDTIELWGKKLYAMVDRVKGSDIEKPAEKPVEKDTLPLFEDIKEDEPVDMSEIPF